MTQRKKILFLTSRFPWPIEKGDKLRAFHMIRELAAEFDVYLFSVTHKRIGTEEEQQLLTFCKQLRIAFIPWWKAVVHVLYSLFWSRKPLQVAYFHGRRTHKQWLRFLDAVQPDVVFCQLIRMAEYAKDIPYRRILDYMDALSAGMERRAAQAPWYLQWIFHLEARRLRRYENQIFPCFDHHIIISEADQQAIRRLTHHSATVIANGVDLDRFCRRRPPEPFTVLFAGNLSYPPNVDAARRLARDIFPLIRKRFPAARLILCGAQPNRWVRQLANAHIEVTGWVPNIVDYYERASVFVAPLRLGSGLQNKILEAMAMEVPCITTPLVNAAIQAVEGQEILLAEDPDEFAAHVEQLWTNQRLRSQLASKALLFVRRHFRWKQNVMPLIEFINKGSAAVLSHGQAKH